ncbi:MAG: kua-ubiquitin conjugating enzyme hybrid localization domain protein, partial [Bacteroidia bacterium]|nr:kua-ubiquitin conjugating enzyme hybrid localization domain protein [Bacteroidia bacterium]
MGLILDPNHHSVHHTQPYNKYYCITCGWLNPVLTKLKFFDGLEMVIRKISGAKKIN